MELDGFYWVQLAVQNNQIDTLAVLLENETVVVRLMFGLREPQTTD
jgi:hypothetical protein